MYFLNFNWNSVEILPLPSQRKKIPSQHLLLRLKNYIYKKCLWILLGPLWRPHSRQAPISNKKGSRSLVGFWFFPTLLSFLLSPIFSPPKEMDFNRRFVRANVLQKIDLKTSRRSICYFSIRITLLSIIAMRFRLLKLLWIDGRWKKIVFVK